MRTHSQPQQSAPRDAATTNGGFLRAWRELMGTTPLPTVPRRRGRKPRVPLKDLLAALTYHVVQGTGTLAEHFTQLFGTAFADSSWSDRRQRLPWEIFAELMQRVLRPRATHRHADAFWRGWRLVALDGTQFSLTNTAQVRAVRAKARSRRGRAAFAKMTAVVLLELGLHNPLAAAIGRARESEWALAPQVLARLPARALLLGDRLYGCAAFAAQALAACQRVGSHFLFRARMLIKPQVLRRLRDGSRLIRVPVRDPTHPSRIVDWLEVREIRVRVGRAGHRARTAAPVDQFAGSPHRPGPRVGAVVCAAMGTRVVFPRSETAAAQDRGAAESHRRHGRPRNRGRRVGQCRPGRRTGHDGGRPPRRPAYQFPETAAGRPSDVVHRRVWRRRPDRAPNADHD